MNLPKTLSGDFWGGLAAMLVAMPSAIAFGVTIYAPLGGGAAAVGAMAGILGAMALGLVAASLGGAPRLISAPCAPAAAVLAAFGIEMLHAGHDAAAIMLMLVVLGLLAGILQVAFGLLRLGKLIEYMPYPVVSGYLTGVGLIIIGSQVPKLLGAERGVNVWQALANPAQWNLPSLAIGVMTAVVMVAAPRFIKRIPAAILGLLAGVLTYFALALAGVVPMVTAANPLVIGPLSSGEGGGFLEGLSTRWQAAGALDFATLSLLILPALTLAGLLSIDTLKTCLVLDSLTRSRHQSNRELIGQGVGNITSAAIGGMPGAGTMGATLVNLSSGGNTRLSGVFEGGMALVAFLVLGSLIAWVPVGALAAILIVIGARMIDKNSLHFLKSRATILDFAVILAVVLTALFVGLIPASAVGILLAAILFIREQIGGAVVRRKLVCNQHFSRRVRTQEEMEILTRDGEQAVICELQGSLFFGTTNQLYSHLEPELKTRRYLILDMRRVQTVDVTAAHMLEQVKDMLAEREGTLIFASIPPQLPSGLDIEAYLREVGLLEATGHVRVFDDVDGALEWVEDQLIATAALALAQETRLDLHDIELFRHRKEHTLQALEHCLEARHVAAGEKIFARGDTGDELFLIRRGAVRILLPLTERQTHHIGTFGRGAFFGEMAFLDGEPRSADAVAFTDVELYVLSRQVFDKFAEEHKKAALALMEGIASVLASRLRYTTAELRALEI
ncbi:MAG: SulP family inorganic anion transporter [Rhodocyclaceae bacterium]|nr:SulP family inorganic anion transporter [Rhodocyclaceae bacterium]MDZ4215871.1 SulP family inorganic anion transporter [Rhodocyclaceae bacterium]